MFDELKHMAADQLARRSPQRRADLQAQLDRWNAVAARWESLSRGHPQRALRRWNGATNMRYSMEWALMNGEIIDARRLAGRLERAARWIERGRPETPLSDKSEVPNIAFPKTLESLAEDFDRREYAPLEKHLVGS
jgi:hypothetical protein